MSNQLPDRLTVALKIRQQYKDRGIPFTTEELNDATNSVIKSMKQQQFEDLPRGAKIYEYEGSEGSAGFFKTLLHNADTQYRTNLVAGSVGTALSLSDSEWAIKTSEDMRKWANDTITEKVSNDPELQAYYAWKQDEPSWTNFDTVLRAASEVIPSLAGSIAGTAVGVGLASATGGSSLAMSVGSLAPMFLLESSSHYLQQMDLMVDEMGLTPEEANEYAGLAAVTYGTISSILERTGARSLMKGTPGLKNLVPEKALMSKITQSLIDSGAKKSAIKKFGMNQVGRLTSIVEKALVEGGTEYSQALAEAISMYATENDFKDGNDFLRTLKESMTTEGSLEQAFGGAIMGIPFGFFGLPTASVINSKKVDKTLDNVQVKQNAGGFNESVVEKTDDIVNDYLSVLVNPGSRAENLGEFLENFKLDGSKISKAIDEVKNDTDLSSALLSLIKKDPSVVASIENHSDSESLLRLASQKLNKQKPKERQIDTDNIDEMVNAIKQFALKGNIKQSEAPSDYNESKSEPEIDFDTNLIDVTPTVEESTAFYGEPIVSEEPTEDSSTILSEELEDSQAAAQAILQKMGTKKQETQKERKVNVGKTGIVSGVKTGRAKNLEGKQVTILDATAKMYKVQELDESGKATGPQMYVYPNQIGIGEEAQVTTQDVTPKKLTAKEMKDFISTGNVSPEVLQYIANKIIDNKKLTKNEEAIRIDKSSEIESLLKKEITPETPKETDVITEEDLLDKKEDVIAKEDLVDKEKVSEKGVSKVEEIIKKEWPGDTKTLEEYTEEMLESNKDEIAEGKETEEQVKERAKSFWESEQRSSKEFRKDPIAFFKNEIKNYKNALKNLSNNKGSENQKIIGADTYKEWLSKAQNYLTELELEKTTKLSSVIKDEDVKDLGEELPEGVPDVNKPVENLNEIEESIEFNQTRAEQNKQNYIIDGVSFDRVSNKIKNAYSGQEYPDAIKAGNIIDGLVRNFFNDNEVPSFDDLKISKDSFDSLMKALGDVKKQIDSRGLRVMSNNIITWDDSSGVAGEIDLLVLNPKTGKIQIWDIKTSKAKTTSKSYDKKWKGNGIVRSKREQHSIQLSAYKRLIENQYGIEVEKIAIFPFYINYTKSGKITYLEKEAGIALDFNKTFIDTIIPQNKMSENISSIVQEVEQADDNVINTSQEPINLNEEPSSSQIDEMRNTLFSKMNDSQTDEEKGYDSDSDIEYDEDDDQQFFQQENVSPLTKISSSPDLAEKIVNRLRKHFGNYITDKTFEGVLNINGRKIVGRAIGNIAEWSRTDATLDTMPHEYAHIYVGLMRDSDLIKVGIKYFGSEEKLVQHIGEYYANRIQNKSTLNRIKIWLKQFANRLKNIFGSIPENTIGDFLAEEFYQGRFPQQPSIEYSKFARYQDEQPIDEDGNNVGISTNSNNAKNIPSDIHIKEFFHKVFGVHIDKSQVPVLSKIAKDSKSFDNYIVNIKNWANEQSKEKSYRIGIKTDYNQADLRELRTMFLKDRDKIYRFVPNDKTGLNTRIFYHLELPVGRETKGLSPRISIAPLERLDTKQKESQSHTTNFVEKDLLKGHHDKKLIFLPVRNILNKFRNKETKKFQYWKGNTKLNTKVLEKLNKAHTLKYITQIIKHGKDKANYLFVLGTKGGDNDAILFGKASQDSIGVTKEQFKDYVNNELAEKLIRKDQAEAMLEEYDVIDDVTASKDIVKILTDKSMLEYIKQNEGESIQDAAKRLLDEITPLIKSLQFAEAISTHEYMKSIKYNKYAIDEKHILDTYTRLSIDLSEGYSPKTEDNSLDSKIMIVPKNTLLFRRDKETNELTDAGIFDVTDGETMSGSDWLSRLGDNIGTSNLGAIKTTIRHRSKDGDNYLGMKHLQMTPFNNLEFFEEGANFPFARVALNENNKTYFEKLDKNGNVIGKFDHIASPNEAKQRGGNFKEDYKIHNIKEGDVKVILNPSNSADTAAHPITFGEILLDPSILSNKDTPEAKNLASEIIKHYDKVSEEYLSLLKAMKKNPKTFLQAVNRTLEEGKIPTEAEKYIEILNKTEGEGIHHKYLTNLFVSYLNNIYFKNGIFKSRKIGKGNATHGYLKPTAGLDIPDKSVAVSSENTTVYNKAIFHWASLNQNLKKSSDKDLSDFQLFNRFTQNKTIDEKIDILNEALNEKELSVLIHRQPIAKVTGVVTRRIAYLVKGQHGDTIFLNHSDVTEVLDGDYDGDHGFMEFIEGDLLKAYKDWQNSETFKEKNKVVAIPMFGEKLEDTTSNATYLSKEAKDAAVVDQASVSGSQGRMTNAKTVMTQLAYKNIKLYTPSLKGGFLSSKKPSDNSIMDYIPLDINQLNKNNGELLKIIKNNNDSIVDENGEAINITEKDDGGLSVRSKDDLFLSTTVEHELSILLQMSVDNKKFGLLSKLGWKNDFVIRRIFKRSDGEELNQSNVHTLRNIFTVQNFSNQRQGKTVSRNAASMTSVVEDSSLLAERFFNPEDGKRLSKEEVGDRYLTEFRAAIKRNKFRYRGEYPSKITTNGAITPGEILISSAGKEHNKISNQIENEEQAGSHFLDWSQPAYEIAHQKTMDKLGRLNQFKDENWSDSAKNEAYKYLIGEKHDILNEKGEVIGKDSLNEVFWKIYENAAKESEDAPIHISADYNEELSNFVDNHIDSWESLSKAGKELATLFFLKGVGSRKNILTLMPIDLMDESVLLKFLPEFTKNLKTIKDSDFSFQGGKIQDQAGYQNLNSLVTKSSKLYKEKGEELRVNCN